MASTPVTKKIGPCGGSGGQVKDMNVTDITRITKVGVRYGWSIDAFTVSYELRNGRKETEVWGGNGGTLQEIGLQENEYITSVKGYYGNFNGMFVVRSLKFETSLGKSYGPYGREEGAPFELHAVTGQIVGFHARSGQVLDAIGIYVKADNTTGGSNASGNTGGSTVTPGSTVPPGSWSTNSANNANFWDRPAGTTGGSTVPPGSWTKTDEKTANFW